MGSKKKSVTNNNSPSDEPKACTNNCGFFGTNEKLRLCSKCYKVEEYRATASKSVSSGSAAEEGSGSKVVKRCNSCNKKVGLMGFVCKCGVTFCGTHRYPDEHECSYDFKAAGRDAISKANPVVKADKLPKI